MKELTIPLELDSRTPLYEQIYEYIKQDITGGKIPPKEKLPSTRLLAKHLQVSRSTIDLAYEQLVSEGYLETVPGSGYFVCDIETGFPERSVRGAQWKQEADCDKQTNTVRGEKISDLQEASRKPKTRDNTLRYDFSPNAIEWSEFSMASWRKATKSMLQEEMEELFLSGHSMGEKNLRQVICDYLHRARGVNCDISQIIVGAGNEYLLMLLYQMLGADKCVAMESPTYRQAYQIFQNLGWSVTPVPMDDSGMRMAELREAKAQLAYIMPSHQFPLGNVMPMKRRMELLQWAGEQEDRYIIEDDYDSEFRYKGKPIPSLQGNDSYDSVIYLGTFSKSIAPAIRVSFMVLPPKLLELYQRRCGFYSSTVSRIQQQTLYHFMKDGYFERHLNKMRRVYRGRHDVLLAELRGKSWVKRIYGENAGLHILVEINTDKTEEELIAAAKEKEIRVYGLREYGIEENDTGKMSGKEADTGKEEATGKEAGTGKEEAVGKEADTGKVKPPTLLLGYAGLDEKQIVEGIGLLDSMI